MNKNGSFRFSSQLLGLTGKWYPILALVLAQLLTSPIGLVLAAMPAQINAELSSEQLMKIVTLAGMALLIRNILLLTWAYINNLQMIRQLAKWSKNEPLDMDTPDGQDIWKKTAAFSWRYLSVAFTTLILFVLVPTLIYMRSNLGASVDQMLYIGMAGVASGLALAIMEIFVIDYLMRPVRVALLPQNAQSQLNGLTSDMLLRTFIVVLVLIFIANLLVAPVGYHLTSSIINRTVDPQQTLTNLRSQLIIASIVSIMFGAILTLFMTRAVSRPLRNMIQAFDQVEKGDLKQHLQVISTDETAELTVYFNQMIARLDTLQTGLEEQVKSRTEQLKATLEVSRVASSTLDPGQIIDSVVNIITDRFGFYYTAIFITESSGRWAELKSATGKAGQALKERKHKLEIGGKSMVSQSIATRQAGIALDVGAEPVRFDNPLLPDTRSEIALPLIVGERAIGALDVQATQQAAFNESDIETLQGMANQVAVALENARLFQETQSSLEELRGINRTYVTNAWSETAHGEHGQFEYLASSETPDPNRKISIIDVPLTLREQIIGQLTLEGQEDWTPEERALIESVATQAALALENARLLEESRQMALRERLAAEITGKIWASPNADFILQTAIKELGRALRADEATIELKID